MTTSQETIELMIGWLDALRRRDLVALAERMAPDVRWQGVRDDLVCRNRDEAIDALQELRTEDFEIDAVEMTAGVGTAVLGMRGAGLYELAGEPLPGQIFTVFTIRDGIVVRMEDHKLRGDALRAAGIEPDAGWL
jgi:hypothetical protein